MKKSKAQATPQNDSPSIPDRLRTIECMLNTVSMAVFFFRFFTMQTIVEFPVNIRTVDIEGFLKGLQSVKFEYQQTDNLHHKYLIRSGYAADFVAIGIYIGRVGSDFSLRSE